MPPLPYPIAVKPEATVSVEAAPLPASGVKQVSWWRGISWPTVFLGGVSGVLAWMLLKGTGLWEVCREVHTLLPLVLITAVMALVMIAVNWENSGEVAKVASSRQTTMAMGDIIWDRNSFCRGWLITGSTGSGKTEMIKNMMHLLCRNEKGRRGPDGNYVPGGAPWGGLCIDEKGFFQEEVLPILGTYKRGEDVVVLQTRPEDAPVDWKPKFCFNLLGDDRVSTSQYVDSILRTAETISKGGGDKGFFKTQAGLHIGAAIDLFRAIRAEQIRKGYAADKLVAPTLRNVYMILTHKPDYDELLKRVGLMREKKVDGAASVGPDGAVKKEEKTQWVYYYGELDSLQIRKGIDHFQQRYWGVKAQEQLEGVKGTIVNYLHWFTDDQVCEVFCREDATFRIDVMDLGRILCLSMPQRLAIPRRYICALMKLLAYAHGKSRNPVRYKYNLLVLWQDEAQRFIQDADGDVDILRQYQMTTVISTQSKSSLYVAFEKKDIADAIILNLRNRIILRAADEQCAEESSKFVGKALRVKKSRTESSSGTSHNYSEEAAYIYEPFQIRNMRDFVAIIMHSGGMRRVYEFAPMDYAGNIPAWFDGKCSPAMRRRLGWMRRGWTPRFMVTKMPKPRMSD